MKFTAGAPSSAPLPMAGRRARAARRRRPDAQRGKRAGRRRDLLVVVNGSASGAGEPEALRARVVQEASRAGARAEGVVTASQSELARAVERAEGRRVVLVGGDGGVHAAANLARPPREIAIVPAGRANNVARALGISLEPEKAAAVAATARARPLDVLRVLTDDAALYCVEAVSAGLQAEARHLYTADNSGALRDGALAMSSALRSYRPYTVDLRGDGERIFSGAAAQVFLSNLPLFGFGFRVDPVARPSDGMLEAIVIEAPSRRRAVTRLLAVRRGRHLDREWSLVRRVREARIEGPLPLVADSRPLGTGSATVSVVRDRLRLAAP